MTLLSVIVILNLAGTAIQAAQSVCQNPIYCPCGSTGKNLTVCLETNDKENELCKTWSKCKTCQDGLHKCLQCEDGFKGPLCSVPKRQALKSRQKRQFYYPVYGRVSQRPKNRLQNKPTQKSVTSKNYCPDPGQVANGKRMNSDGSPSVDVQQYKVGQSVVYTCNPGYALQNQTLITCLASGTWSSTTPYCSRVQSLSPIVQIAPERPRTRLKYCSDLGVDSNGSRRPTLPPNSRGFLQGSRVEYFCNEGFDLNGDLEIFCLSSGKWSAGRPKCEEQFRTSDTDFRAGLKGPPELAYCPNPGTVSNGRFVYYPSITSRGRRAPPLNELNPEYPEGSRLQYSCDSGYALEGSASLTCETSGLWSAESPVCRRGPRL